MTLPYYSRLLCLVFASFFLVQLSTGVLIGPNANRFIQIAERLPVQMAPRFLLALRLLPFVVGSFAALGFCLPSYLWFEPEPLDEPVGVMFLISAMVGLCLITIALARTVRVAEASVRFSRHCRQAGTERTLAPNHPPVLVIQSRSPLLALTGIFRPRVIVSECVVEALSAGELSAVLCHERAHGASLDNLKRLCLTLAPELFPAQGGRELERAWVRFTEFAADQAAVAGDAKESIALASALVRVARFGTVPAASPSTISFLGEGSDLAARVDRLLFPSTFLQVRRVPLHTPGLVLIGLGSLLAVSLRPATFQLVQSVLERLIH